MKHLHLNKIKNLESSPKKVNIFSEKEIKMIKELYYNLPERMFNKKQNVRKKVWIQNHNKDLHIQVWHYIILPKAAQLQPIVQTTIYDNSFLKRLVEEAVGALAIYHIARTTSNANPIR